MDPIPENSLMILIYVQEASAGLVIPGIVLLDCLTQKRESYLLGVVRLFLKDAHNDVVTGSIQTDRD